MPTIIKHEGELARAIAEHPKKTVVLEHEDGTTTVWRAGGGKPVRIPKAPVPRYVQRNEQAAVPDGKPGTTAKVDRK